MDRQSDINVVGFIHAFHIGSVTRFNKSIYWAEFYKKIGFTPVTPFGHRLLHRPGRERASHARLFASFPRIDKRGPGFTF